MLDTDCSPDVFEYAKVNDDVEGALILGKKKIGTASDQNDYIILALWNGCEYVTWRLAANKDKYMLMNGHYYLDNIVRAAKDFGER